MFSVAIYKNFASYANKYAVFFCIKINFLV